MHEVRARGLTTYAVMTCSRCYGTKSGGNRRRGGGGMGGRESGEVHADVENMSRIIVARDADR